MAHAWPGLFWNKQVTDASIVDHQMAIRGLEEYIFVVGALLIAPCKCA
jgi:hypothetical protein